VKLAWPKTPKIICSPSYVANRSRANTTRWLDFDNLIEERAHKGDLRIGKMTKKLDRICCPQCREIKADTLQQLRPIGQGDQEWQKRLDQEELT
jgi:hypothetical protein